MLNRSKLIHSPANVSNYHSREGGNLLNPNLAIQKEKYHNLNECQALRPPSPFGRGNEGEGLSHHKFKYLYNKFVVIAFFGLNALKQQCAFLVLGCILALLFSSPASFAQSLQLPETIVNFSSGKITSEEFLNRMNFSFPVKHAGLSADSLKKQFLYSLVAEKLWAAEAYRQRLDTLESLQAVFTPIYKAYVVDALYQQEVASKVVILPADIVHEMEKMKVTPLVWVFSSTSKQTIAKVRDLVLAGKKPDDITVPGVSKVTAPIELVPGQMEDEAIEDTVFNLPVGAVSNPLQANGKWFLFEVADRKVVETPGLTNSALQMKAEQMIRRRRSSNIENRFRDSLFSSLRVETDGALFKLAGKTIAKILTDRYNAKDWDTTKEALLLQDDISILQNSIGKANFDKPFILFAKDPLTLGEALAMLPFKPFGIKHPTQKKVALLLQSFFKQVTENEVLYREAVKRHLNTAPDVQEKAEEWKENLLADLFSGSVWNSLIKSANSDAAGEAHKTLYRVISVKYMGELMPIMEAMANGVSFDSLYAGNQGFVIPEDAQLITAKVYELLQNQIEKPVASNPPGVYGPFESKGNYILLKKYNSPRQGEASASPAEMKKQLRHMYEDRMEKVTNELFIKYGVKIDYQVLGKLDPSTLNTFTVHNMGFGNKLPAFPMTTPYFEWSRRLDKSQLP